MTLSSSSAVPNRSAGAAAIDSVRLGSQGAWLGPRGITFRVFSTTARSVAVRLLGPGAPATHPLAPRGEGLYEGLVSGAGAGTRYKILLDDRELPDPYARSLPEGVHGPALVEPSAYRWRHDNVLRPLREHVIYELHVGTFSPAGTYAGALPLLPQLVELGVTALELMPVAAFAGVRGWGYDGVAPFAPHAPYGTPDELRALVDEAHRLGLAVLLDVVYNHFGPSGNYFGAYSPEYFSHDVKNAWGDAPNFAHPALRRLVIDNALYWLTEFRFDGLRLDAVHAIKDPSPRHIVAELCDEVARVVPGALLIGEDDRNEPALVTDAGLSALWADDFHHAVRVTLTGERDGYYAAYSPGVETIVESINAGWLYRGQVYPPSGKPRGKDPAALPAEAFVYCIQNHDQIGNRAFGDRLSAVVGDDAYCAASALLLFLPMTPLLFMGQEWAASTPFQYFTDHEPELGRLITEGRRREFKTFAAMAEGAGANTIPDPQSPATFARSRLDWAERSQAPHARVLALYRELLRLRKTDPVLHGAGRAQLAAEARGALLLVRRWSDAGTRVLAVNFGADAASVPDGVPLLATTSYERGAPLPGHAAVILAV